MITVSPPEVTHNKISPCRPHRSEPENPQIFRPVRELSGKSRPSRKRTMECASNDLTPRERYKVADIVRPRGRRAISEPMLRFIRSSS